MTAPINIDQLRQQQTTGFRWLRFQPELESRYQAIRDEGIRERARPVCASALVLFLVYALLDWVMLPDSLARQTIFVRLLITCPTISLVWWLSWRPMPSGVFLRVYGMAYLVGGLSVVGIIGIARLNNFPLPYEGILLMLMFGYFAMGIPFRLVSALSLIIVAAYLVMEAATGMTAPELAVNGFFIMTANIVGMVGSWLSEHRQRAHFLDRQMLEALRDQAEVESKRKSNLITVASHDLRQPLNIISLILENLKADGLPDEQLGLVTRLKSSVTHFNGLLASVLDISRLQEGMVKPEPEPLRPARVLAQLHETCGERADNLGVELAFSDHSGDQSVLADPQLLHRILQNLVFNALDHSGASRITVRAGADKGRLVFTVEDDGRGIDQTTRSKIFDPFVRSRKADDPGLGLGLAIVKELSELMDGRCTLAGDSGTGARFRVTLPSCPGEEAPEKALSFSPDSPHPGLLVVEDHDESRHWLQRTLSGWGYNVHAFADAEQALTHSETLSNAILVTDLHLPEKRGDQLFDHLSQKQAISGGVMVTADTSMAEGYNPSLRLWTLHKPLQPMRLRAALQQLMRR
ncbi:hybrid sensor histidine kinase/response regulator [Marinobacter sp. CHS3-4]|uniref:hybrid sensor histidine kinase/response regulator n=1 Tax=Marinobacter sp. CHS3-4 TaxID=3045174 RepID=UPI0024B4FF1F|nr:hybrid sensor histidine kinase/response regulator [Marinobacter sp. CHS3-4]MDI9244210.1 hybrid sensor histidine kinase/response regulator [Marinobacter sp. CHS3-4]